jgi:hypothetical protein
MTTFLVILGWIAMGISCLVVLTAVAITALMLWIYYLENFRCPRIHAWLEEHREYYALYPRYIAWKRADQEWLRQWRAFMHNLGNGASVSDAQYIPDRPQPPKLPRDWKKFVRYYAFDKSYWQLS